MKRKSKLILAILIMTVIFSINAMSSFASVAHKDTFTYHRFIVPEEGFGYLYFYADCHYTVNEVYTTDGYIITATSRSVTAYMEYFTGDLYGLDCSCLAPYNIQYYNGSTNIGSQSLSPIYIFPDPNWDYYDSKGNSTAKYFSYDVVTASATSSFYCEDAINYPIQTTSVYMYR